MAFGSRKDRRFAGAVGIAWILGIYAMAGGIVLIALGVRLRAKLTEVLA